MTLATICRNALYEIGGFQVPTSFYGNPDLTARQCLALVTRAGKTLERDMRWQELLATYTFETVSDQAEYDLPSDFRAFANMSQWDRTGLLPVIGPANGALWQYLQSSSTGSSVTINRWFRLAGNEFVLFPTPSVTGDTIAFDYYSKNWITLSAGGTAADFASDNDTPRLDEELLTMDLKWRFLQAKGMPFEAEYREWESIKTSLSEDNGGKGVLCMGRPRMRLGNIPETGFGG